ncbi:MAG: PQQ-binding-like beta-propeller repeat protein [Vicinamibacterales bacterium]
MRHRLLAILLSVGVAGLWAQSRGTQNGDWPLHSLDIQSSRFSPLSQITQANAGRLAVKWQLDLPKPASVGSGTPVVVGGIMYLNSGPELFAVDGTTGKILWNRKATADFPMGGRGPAYGDGRIYAAGRSMLAAFDAENGRPITTFGTNGILNPAKVALEFKDPGKYAPDMNPEDLGYFIASAPTYANGTLFIGLASSEGVIRGGLLAAIDGVTGKVKWVFRTIPQGPGDDGWELTKDTWSGPDRTGGGIWSQPAVDPALGLVFANVSNPTNNYDGSQRKGSNLFTNAIVAVGMQTGKLKWHFQTIHHDIWDWDLIGGPTLFDTTINGRSVKALASLPKTCYVYALERETGKPLYPIVEMAVPTKTDVPGEEVYPTQPIPFNARHVQQSAFCATFPPPAKDPALDAKARPIFTPPLASEPILISPGATGGPGRGPSSFSPRTGLLYVTGKNDAMLLQTRPRGDLIKSGLGSPGHFQSFTVWERNLVQSSLNVAAYDPKTGDLSWVTELPGVTNASTIVNAGDVVFQGVNRDVYALDAKTGKQLAHVPMKISVAGSPLAFQAGGREFIAFASGGSVVALGLP